MDIKEKFLKKKRSLKWFQERIGLYDTIFYMNYSYNDLIRDSEINNGSGNSIRCLRDV